MKFLFFLCLSDSANKHQSSFCKGFLRGASTFLTEICIYTIDLIPTALLGVVLYRYYHGHPLGCQLVTVLTNGFNFILRLSQISYIYFSLVHLNTSIYRKLVFHPSEADNTSSDTASTSSYDTTTTLGAARTAQIYRLSFVLQSLSIFFSIESFGVLHVI